MGTGGPGQECRALLQKRQPSQKAGGGAARAQALLGLAGLRIFPEVRSLVF